MPAADSILSWATAVANEWQWLAISWHGALGAFLVAVLSGVRPPMRVVAVLLVLPVISVSAVAAISGNPFNALTFAVLALLLSHTAMRLPQTPVTPATPAWVLAGCVLVTIGWTYPHFLRSETWTAYAYASPFGLLPCPTLLVVAGASIIFGSLRSLRWSVLVLTASILYGSIGVAILHVSLDMSLLAGAVLLGAMLVTAHRTLRRVC